MMADAEQKQFVNMNKSGSDDSFSYNEWTIIDEKSNDKAQKYNVIERGNEGSTDSNDSDGSNDTDARYDRRKARDRIQVHPEPSEDALIKDKSEEFIEQQVEESDDISVITESEVEQSIVNKRFGEIDRCESLLSGMLKKYEKPSDKTALQVGSILNVVIACSLAAIIGLGAGRILSMDDKCPISSGIDFGTIRSENNMLIGQLKELSEVKDVLDEIKASIPQMKPLKQKSCKGQIKSTSKKLKKFKDPIKISDTYSFDPDITILEQLQISFSTLCSVIDGIYHTEKPFRADMLKTQNVIMDLIAFKKLVNSVIKELDDIKKPMEIRFLRETESKIENICQSLLSDLSDVMHKLTIKIHQKLNKVRHKLNKRLCFLRNKESDDNKILKSFVENNAFLESCNKILNVTLKSHDSSADIKKLKNKKDQNISQKFAEINERSLENSSNGDSSIPDLTYNRHDDFWKKKQTVEGDHQRQIKSDKAISHKINSQKGPSGKSMKSTNQCSKSVIMDALLPIDTCPIPQISWSRAESVYAKSKEIKVPVLDSTPLTLLKPTHVTVQSDQNSTKVKDASKKWAVDDIQAEYLVAVSEVKERDLIKKANANVESRSTEARHDVTPVNSNVNVQTVKRLKEQWSEKVIQHPLTYSHDVIQHNDAPEEIALEQATENIELSNDFYGPKGQKDSKREKKRPIVPASFAKINKKRLVDPNYNDKKDGNVIRFEKNTKKKMSKQKNKEMENIDNVNSKLKSPSCKFTPSEMKEKKYKKSKSQQKLNDSLNGEWQLQRSRARKEIRDREHESEWYFDRANSRRNARKDEELDTRFYTSETCPLFVEEDTYNEELYNYWFERKNMDAQKHSSNRAGYIAKKFMKMPHRKNIFQTRRR